MPNKNVWPPGLPHSRTVMKFGINSEIAKWSTNYSSACFSHAFLVTGNMEIRNLVQPSGTKRIVSAAFSSTGVAGNAWASEGFQSNVLAGNVTASGASKGE
jgi:hypothetical protein